MVGGRINDPMQAEKILVNGYADMVGMARAFIADPEFANKARDGRTEDIRKCIGCNEGCRYRSLMRSSPGLPIGCTVNASVGREEEMEIRPAAVRKRVLIAGGGPAGMEAARVADLRGHHVTLYERGAELGGHIAIIARDPNLEERAELVRYLEHELRKSRVEVKLGIEVTPELIAEMKPEAVVVATGSVPYIPQLPGIDSPNVVTNWQVLRGEVHVGDNILVVGGLNDDLGPPSIAELLADQGKKVEVLSETMMVGYGLEPGTLHVLTRHLLEKGVILSPLTGLKSISGRSIEVSNTFTKEKRNIDGVDTVVLAAGMRANDRLYRELKCRMKEVYAIGDCLAPRRTINAVLEGSRVGRMI
jgi:pyruvate/2-oxoglutarate dehydrogenase complex dihydrolipoamide dehydrogenase (E3) component